MATTDRAGWRGRPMRETARSIAAEYTHGDRIRLRACPDPGTISEVRCHDGQIQYRADWDLTPWDLTWYDEDAVQLLDGGDDD
jgi:hypothetical protein